MAVSLLQKKHWISIYKRLSLEYIGTNVDFCLYHPSRPLETMADLVEEFKIMRYCANVKILEKNR